MVVGRESQYICPFRYLLGLHIRKVSKNVVTSVLALSPLVSKARPTLVSLRDLILIFRRASLSLSAMDPGLQIRGEPVHPDREIRGGPSLKKMFFQSFGPQSGMKIMGGGPPGPLPWIRHGLLNGSPPLREGTCPSQTSAETKIQAYTQCRNNFLASLRLHDSQFKHISALLSVVSQCKQF